MSNHEFILGDGIQAIEKYKDTHALFYDPPWDMDIPDFSHSKEVIALCDGRRAKDVVNRFGAPDWVFTWDCVSSWYTPNRPLQRAKYAFAYFDFKNCTPGAFRLGNPGKSRIVSNTRGEYLYVPDGEKRLSDVFSYPITSHKNHPHQKPVEWIAFLISTCFSLPVIDPFCGSGAVAAACDDINVDSIHYEIDEPTWFKAKMCWRELSIHHYVNPGDLFDGVSDV